LKLAGVLVRQRLPWMSFLEQTDYKRMSTAVKQRLCLERFSLAQSVVRQ
jgi:hypothetical protein